MVVKVGDLILEDLVPLRAKVGDLVLDNLTCNVHTVVRIEISRNGSVGIFIDSDYLGGGRHPWEISELK